METHVSAGVLDQRPVKGLHWDPGWSGAGRSHLAERAWVTLLRQEPYVIRDLEGNPISVAEGKAIVAEHFKVPEEVRRRRRTKKKGGKVLQVLKARVKSASRRGDKRGDLPRAPASSASPTSSRGTLVTA
jgi:hypothetical protein